MSPSFWSERCLSALAAALIACGGGQSAGVPLTDAGEAQSGGGANDGAPAGSMGPMDAGWTLATSTPGFTSRAGNALLVYDGKMWVIGGRHVEYAADAGPIPVSLTELND